MATYRLFPSGNPANLASYTGNFLCGAAFKVTSQAWLTGYWWWVFASGQSTAAQTFALWQAYGTSGWAHVPGADVTSGTLTAGQWNFVALGTPVALAIGVPYEAETGFTNNFTDDQNQFGAGQPYASGITQGPLFAYSDQGASAPAPFSIAQGNFGTSGTDPTTIAPGGGDVHSNFGIDLQVSDTAPASPVYRLWPNMPHAPGNINTDAVSYTLSTEFSLTQACALRKIWHYSPPGCLKLPSRCGIWDVGSTTVVAGTDNASPSWVKAAGGAAAAGDGWVYADYSGAGVTLNASHNYKTAVFGAGGGASNTWFALWVDYWDTSAGTTWPNAGGAGGLAYGPLTAPDNSGATPGQSSYNTSTWAYPNTTAGSENFWTDVEVAPVSTAAGVPAPQLAVTRTEVIGGGRGGVGRAVRM